MRGDVRTSGGSKLGNRRDISRDERCSEGRMTVPGGIGQPVEGDAVAAGRTMCRGSLNGVVPMDDVSDRIQRERQQQANESDS